MARIIRIGRLVLLAAIATLAACVGPPRTPDSRNVPGAVGASPGEAEAREEQLEREDLGMFRGGAAVGQGAATSGGVGHTAPAMTGTGGNGPGGTSGASGAGGGGGY